MQDEYRDSAIDKLNSLLNGAVEKAGENAEPIKPVKALVTGIDTDGVYVKTDGDDTAKGPFPTAVSVSEGEGAVIGDRVLLTKVGNTWVVTSNLTNPSADQETVDEAWTNANVARQAAQQASSDAATASSAAAQAVSDAAAASSAASAASSAASAASSAAAAADAKAVQAATAAATADTKATQAATSAAQANAAARGALSELGSVEDVLGTLNWITNHASFALTQDVTIDTSKVYYVVDSSSPYGYSPVAEPDVADIGTYYEMSLDAALSNYVASHLALTNDGLFILKDNNGYRLKLNNQGWYIIDPQGNVVNQATSNGSDIGYTDDFHTHITDKSISLRKDNSDLFEVKSDGTTTEIATGEGRLYSIPLNTNFYILNAQNNVVVDILLYSENFDYQSDLLSSGWVVKPLNASTSSSSGMSTQSTAPAPGPGPGPSGSVIPCDVYQYGKVVYHVESSSVVKDASSGVLTGWRAIETSILGPQSTETSVPNSGMNFWVNKDFARMQVDCGLLDLLESGVKFTGKAQIGRGLEIVPGANQSGYIDFHYGGSSADYTSRIIETSSGVLDVKADLCANGALVEYAAPEVTSGAGGDTYLLIDINSEEEWMLAFDLCVYAAYTDYVIRISGYNYGTNHWYAPRATLVTASNGVTSKEVHFGYYANTKKLWVCLQVGGYVGASIQNVSNGYRDVSKAGLFTFTYVNSIPSVDEATRTAVIMEHAHNYAGSDSAGGVANSAKNLYGFNARASSAGWGNQTGTFVTGWDDPTGGSVAFRRDNPNSGQLSMLLDGTLYVNEGSQRVTTNGVRVYYVDNVSSSYGPDTQTFWTNVFSYVRNNLDKNGDTRVAAFRVAPGWRFSGFLEGIDDTGYCAGIAFNYSKFYYAKTTNSGSTWTITELAGKPVNLCTYSWHYGDVDLSQSAGNFNRMKIYFHDNYGQLGSVEVCNPNYNLVHLTTMQSWTSSTGNAKRFWNKVRTVYITGTQIKTYSDSNGGWYGQIGFNQSGAWGIDEYQQICIYRVDAWNE